MRKYVISILLTGCISALFGLIFIDNFKVVFAIATLFQFIGFYIFNNIYENLLQRKAIYLNDLEYSTPKLTMAIVKFTSFTKCHQNRI